MTRTLVFLTILFSLVFEAEAQYSATPGTTPLQTETDNYGRWGSLPLVQLFQRVENSRLPDAEDHVSYFEVYELDNTTLSNLLRDKRKHLVLSLGFAGQTNQLLLTRHEILKEGSRVVDQDYNDLNIEVNALFYRGTIQGKANSFVVVSIFEDEIRIVFSYGIGNYRYSKSNSGLYIAHRESDLIDIPEFSCGLSDENIQNFDDSADSGDERSSRSSASCQYVEIFFECDFHFRTAIGSNSGVINQVNAIFNEVQTIYYNEYIPLIISDIMIWNQIDPYYNIYDCIPLLASYSATRGSNFNGRLAHLISNKSATNVYCGRAYLDVICSNNQQHGVSNFPSWSFDFFPNYSFSVYLVSHELGHNFGSRHTQWCGWSGGPIDNCATQENDSGATCSTCCSAGSFPLNGGTIMSYCNPNVNFSLGFGIQPGNKIRQRYSLATCYSNCNTWVDHDYGGFPISDGSFQNPWTNLPDGVDAVQNNGNIFIKNSTGSETPLIDVNKTFMIRTWNGSSIVGVD